MADLTEQQASQAIKITGSDSTGIETNYVGADSNGNLQVVTTADGPVTPGTVASKSALAGIVFNTSLPTLTTGQQAALQADANARLIIAPLTNSSVVKSQLQDNAGTAITLGQKAMASSLPVVIASDQSTLAISAASLPLPTDAASATNQNTQITSLQLIDNPIGSPTGGTAGTSSFLIGGIYNTTPPTLTNGQQASVQLDANGRVTVDAQGNVSSGSTDSGNPLKIGGVYNTTLPTVTNGQRIDLQLDANGRLLTSSAALPSAASKFAFGQLSTSTSTAFLAVEATTYTEPTTNSAMTIVSASASDSSAGTGARTVTVTYLDQTGAGPFTTTFTMNGTTPVTAGVSNMCFVEKIVVTTVGSTGSNVGILTLKTGGAVTVGTIAATINQTLWAHHYIPTSKTCYISGFSFGNNSTAAGNGAQFVLKAATPTVANTPEIQVSDFLIVAGATSTDTRNYLSPIQVIGPARVRAYVFPNANAATLQFASFDFIDN